MGVYPIHSKISNFGYLPKNYCHIYKLINKSLNFLKLNGVVFVFLFIIFIINKPTIIYNEKTINLVINIPLLVCGQGEQLYADGTATDQDGNTFEWINYGTQDWVIENAEVVTYSDGTPIPQVTDAIDWERLMTGAWCYVDNDSTNEKFYNWYAVMESINDENTPNKKTLLLKVGQFLKR